MRRPPASHWSDHRVELPELRLRDVEAARRQGGADLDEDWSQVDLDGQGVLGAAPTMTGTTVTPRRPVVPYQSRNDFSRPV